MRPADAGPASAVRGRALPAGRATGAVRAVVVLALVVTIGGCGDAHRPPPAPPGPRPADPQQWICDGGKTLTTEADVDAWCRAPPARGAPVPDDLRSPPPPADFMAYQAYNRRLETFLTTKQYASLGWIHD